VRSASVGVTTDGGFGYDDELELVDRLFAEALRHAASPKADGEPAKSPMGAALAEACRLSRARGLEPERVIILLKGTWGRVRDTHYASADAAQDALDRTITACIHHYFADHVPSAEKPTTSR